MKKLTMFLGSIAGGIIGVILFSVVLKVVPSLATSTSALWSWVFPSQGYTVPLSYGLALNTTATTYSGLAGVFNTQTTPLAVFSSTTGLTPIFEIAQNGNVSAVTVSAQGAVSGSNINNTTHVVWNAGNCTTGNIASCSGSSCSAYTCNNGTAIANNCTCSSGTIQNTGIESGGYAVCGCSTGTAMETVVCCPN